MNQACEAYEIPKKRACRLLELEVSTFYYQSRRPDDGALRLRLKELAAIRVRFGYKRLHTLLKREGWEVNQKKVYRLYTEEGLTVRTKKRKKIASRARNPLKRASRTNEQWSMDFVHDRFETGKTLRVLGVVDNFSRECLMLEAGKSMNGERVAACLERVAGRRGYPRSIRVDNGSEFYSKAMDRWAYLRGVQLEFIRPGRPVENAYAESFNSRLRDECLNVHLFFDVEDAQRKLDEWRDDYNYVRPHGSLGNRTPVEARRAQAELRSPTAPSALPVLKQEQPRLQEALH